MEKGKASPRGTTGSAGGSTGAPSASIGTQPGRAGTEWAGDTATSGSSGTRQGSQAQSRPGNGHEHSGVVDQVKERAAREISSQKGRATGELDAVAQAVRDASHRLRDEHHETVATYVEQAAGQLERLSRTLREKDLNELLHDAQRLARRQPAWFIGGSFALGLLAARFLKSSSGGDSEGQWRWPEGNRGPWTDPEWRQGHVPEPGYPRGDY